MACHSIQWLQHGARVWQTTYIHAMVTYCSRRSCFQRCRLNMLQCLCLIVSWLLWNIFLSSVLIACFYRWSLYPVRHRPLTVIFIVICACQTSAVKELDSAQDNGVVWSSTVSDGQTDSQGLHWMQSLPLICSSPSKLLCQLVCSWWHWAAVFCNINWRLTSHVLMAAFELGLNFDTVFLVPINRLNTDCILTSEMNRL